MYSNISGGKTPRERHLQQIREAKAEFATATGYRKADLGRHIKRLLRELRTYDRFTKEHKYGKTANEAR